MSRRLKIRDAAEEEFNDAADWYFVRDPPTSDRFVSAIQNTLETIKRNPHVFPIVSGNLIRGAIVRDFPYSIYFTVDEDLISILSIFHHSRNPIIWRGRVD
jgi:plasmid stabilization system protein ParE